MTVIEEKKIMDLISAFCLFVPIDFALLDGTGKIKIKDDRKIKRETNLDRHDPRPITNVCYLLGHPSFSLHTIFENSTDLTNIQSLLQGTILRNALIAMKVRVKWFFYECPAGVLQREFVRQPRAHDRGA